MGITERREREREEIRRKILDAAREQFATEGYEKVTMRGIADAIEYSPTTIYHHFEDKDDVVRCLCDEDFGRLLQAFEAVEPPEDAVEWIRQIGLAYARFGLAHPNHYRFMFMTPAKAHLKQEGVLRTAVAKAMEQGRLRGDDIDAVAQVLWSSLHGAVALLTTLEPEMWPVAPARPDLIERVMDATMFGLLSRPEDTPRGA
jgi:AcrR family transcriptional regulator